MLYSETWIRKFPIYTAGALFSAQSITAAKNISSCCILFITKKQDKLYFGISEDFLPVLSSAPFTFQKVTPLPALFSYRKN